MARATVVIVGGGPAGVSAALFLSHRRPDLTDRILVLEKERYPREKICAGAIGGRADRALAGIGVRVDVPSVVVTGVSIAFAGGHVQQREGVIGRVIRRIEFDRALADAARARGIRIVEGARVGGLVWRASEVVVQSSAGDFEAAAVIGADGVGSAVRRAMGLPFGRMRAQVVEVDTEPRPGDRPRDVLHFDLRSASYLGYVWDFPTIVDGAELVCRGAYVLHAGAIHGGRQAGSDGPWVDAEQALGARMTELGLDLGRYRLKRFAERGLETDLELSRPRALLAGEAAGIDPMLGEGIAQAIEYGALAGAYLAEKLEAEDLRFEDWTRRVLRSRLGIDIRLRSRVMHRFFSGGRREIERYVRAEPSFLRVGMQYFGGLPVSRPNAARAASAGAMLIARLGVDYVRDWIRR